MKNLLFILLGGVLAFNVNAQNPIAVNDTFDTFFETSITKNKGQIHQNDTIFGGIKIIDTLIYNGTNQLVSNYYTGTGSWLGLNNFTYTPQFGFVGLDSLIYVLTTSDTLAGFDTAMIYINVKRKNYETLDLNNVSAFIHKEVLFQNPITYPATAGFNVPKQNNVADPFYNTIFGANLWIVGDGYNGQLKGYAPTSGPTYYEVVNDAGPINIENDFYNEKWDRVWKVNQTDIDYHNTNYTIGGYQPIEVIANWPAHGDTSLGQAYNLAPFVDVDNDGFYNPLNGDYPRIKGQQAVYFIKNDKRTLYNFNPIGAEIHGMAYAYDCPSDSALNHTIFLNYKIYNRSSFTLTSAYVGLWADFDIGNFGDDYIGCDVARGAFYGYNGDFNDESSTGIDGYGLHPPAQSVVFLKGPKQENDGIDNPLTTNVNDAIAQNGIPYAGLGIGFGDGIADNEYLGMEHFMYYSSTGGAPGDGDPNTPVDFYYYLQGKSINGDPLTWANDSLTPADYMFPGDSDPLFWGTSGITPSPLNWDEVSAGNTPADRRGLGSTGPFTMQAGEMIELDLAFVFGRDYQNTGNMAGVVVMQERIDSIRSYYLDDFQSVCGGTLATNVNELKEKENNLQVYPNPFHNQFMVNYELESSTAQLLVFNIYGKQVSSKTISKATNIVDLTNEANGIYFVQITDGVKRITQKLVKQ
jgi:hypothetical protein